MVCGVRVYGSYNAWSGRVTLGNPSSQRPALSAVRHDFPQRRAGEIIYPQFTHAGADINHGLAVTKLMLMASGSFCGSVGSTRISPWRGGFINREKGKSHPRNIWTFDDPR